MLKYVQIHALYYYTHVHKTKSILTVVWLRMCVVDSHIDSIRLQRAITEIVCVVLCHTAVVFSDHVCF